VADPVSKPANPGGATAGKPAPSSPAPAAAPSGAKPAAGTPAAAPAAPKPIASIDYLIERAEDRFIPKGSTVRVSPDNPDVASKARQDELEDSLQACGIKVIWDKSLGKTDIVVEAGKAKS
jgi:hypothetical protein